MTLGDTPETADARLRVRKPCGIIDKFANCARMGSNGTL